MNLSLRISMALLMLAGLATSLGFFGWIAVKAIKHESDDLLKERLTVAYAAAAHLDNTLNTVRALLDTAVDFKGGLPSEKQFVVAERLIREAFSAYGVEPLDIGVVDHTGRVVLDIPEDPEMLGGVGYEAYAYPAVRKALEARRYAVSEVVFDPLTQMPAVLLVSPIFDSRGAIAGAIIAEIGVRQLHLLFLASPMLPEHFSADGRGGALGNTGFVELIDANGVIIDRTEPGPPVEKDERSKYADEFVLLIGDKKAIIETYVGPEETVLEKYIMAFAPVQTVPWGVVIWQSESEVLDAAIQLKQQLLTFGAVFLVIYLALIWIGMQKLVKPILLLTHASKRVGEGNFDIEIPIKSRDEFGQLATAFRTMTGQLSQARDTMSKLYQSEKEKEELRGRLLQEVVAAQEEERKRIARELHDDLAQTVTALIMRLESLEKSPLAQQPPFKQDIVSAREMATYLLDSTRDLTAALRPSDLDVLGLVPAIRSYVEDRADKDGINFHFQASGLDKRLPALLETALFRIMQELIRNVEKHASAAHVHMRLEAVAESVRLVVEDDGQGFDVDDVSGTAIERKHFGLVGIRERVDLLGGDAKVESEAGMGTRVTVTVPLPPQ